jgi:nucleoside 2-deoxyribosyltransferase
MFKIYYASAIDVCVQEAYQQIEEFKRMFYRLNYNEEHERKSTAIEVCGAGFGKSPVLDGPTPEIKKDVVAAYDLRMIRGCDILLVVTNLKTFAAGTFMEFEYARQQGLYIIVCVMTEHCVHNIFINKYADKIVYGVNELEKALKELV